jgi:hypothetical protein
MFHDPQALRRALPLLTLLALPLPPAATLRAAGGELDLRIVGSRWGTARRETVHRVLRSAADQLTPFFAEQPLPPLLVEQQGGPITLYRRGPGGEIIIRLQVRDTYWAQYCFQFAHELCHVLCRTDQDPHGQDWLEESLCECASLFVLRRMADRWQRQPPWPACREFAPQLRAYAERRMRPCRLPAETSLAQWYLLHRNQLQRSGGQRQLNGVVATALLAFFEADPRRWRAVGYLNTARPSMPQSLSQLLLDWRDACPASDRPVVRQLAARFGLKLPLCATAEGR